MITDEMLCKAAAKSNEIYVSFFESTYDHEQEHSFSRQFEKKIKKLKRKAEHPFFYRSLQRVASIILAISISASVWLAVDVKAREAFFGWIKEVYENFFVYRYQEEAIENATPKKYELGWIPEGYSELWKDETDGTVSEVYMDENSLMLTFKYNHNPGLTDWFIYTEQTVNKQATVNGNPAELFISQDSKISSSIVWTSSENTAFYISAFLSESDLIRMAESVKEIN